MTTTRARLQALELQGYKTFATRSEFVFAPTVTAIVGPNGSGKSNIADAMRWVLGEQSYSLLRGKKTEDMIFTGSESRPRSSMAAASITFDNTTGWLPIDFTEVTIGRRAYRDGQNEYLINGQKVRLREVSELLARAGLAQRTYTIIGQGLVDAALSLKAEERRRLFEEAAGIGLYRSRREETLRRLDTTRRNLERVRDILAELRPRLRSLERQAQRSRDYEQVKEDLKEALRVWYGFHYHQLLETVAQAREAAGLQARARDDLRQGQIEGDRLMEETRSQIHGLRAELQTWSQESSGLYGRREQLGRQLAVAGERRRWLDEQAQLMQAEVAALELSRSELQMRLTEAESGLTSAASALAEIDTERQSLRAGGTDLAERQTWISRSRSLREGLESLAARRAALETRQSGHATRSGQLSQQLDELKAAAAHSASLKSQAAQAAAESASGFESASAELDAAQADRRSAETALESARSSLESARETRASIQTGLAEGRARWEALRSFSDDAGAAVRSLVEAGHAGQLSGVLSQIAGLAAYRGEHETAILSALGAFAQGLSMESPSDVLSALAWLETNPAGGQMALVQRTPGSLPPRVELPDGPGVVGLARDLVRPAAGAEGIFDLLLGRSVIVENRGAVSVILAQLPHDARVITLAGEVFYPGGAVLAGVTTSFVKPETLGQLETSLKALEARLSAADSQIREMETEAERARRAIEDSQNRLDQARARLEDATLRHSRTKQAAAEADSQHQEISAKIQILDGQLAVERRELEELSSSDEDFEADRARLEGELAGLQRRLQAGDGDSAAAQVESRWEMAQRSLVDAESRRDEFRNRLEVTEAELSNWSQRAEGNRVERERLTTEWADLEAQAAEAEQALQSRSTQMAPSETALQEAEHRRSQLEAEESRLRGDLRLAEHRYSEAQIELARREEEFASLKRRIEDDFGLVSYETLDDADGQEPLPIEGLVERLPRIESLPAEQEAAVIRLRTQLRRMGAVNPEAQQEHHEVKERVEFLTAQVDDLRAAETQLQEVIAELDVLMEREFRKTFEAVASAFKDTFHRLFGGGSAKIMLTDPADPNQSGIEIEARLPGKREQGLAVLSGGERSLTACALVFALLKVSPTPFCVLDEVDAMLDEANVERFQEMLTELSRDTQFIVITHNRQTVQAAKAVYGISMGSDSASKVISLDLERATREAAA